MTFKHAIAAACVAVPALFAAQAFAQGATSARCDLTLRYVSEQEPKIADPQKRADVQKLWREAQVFQKANDEKNCIDRLEQAMVRGNIPKR